MIEQPIKMEGFIPIFSLILNNPKFTVEQLTSTVQQPNTLRCSTAATQTLRSRQRR